MRSKHEIPNKNDYMKAYSFNFILIEKTNSELEHEKNVGKIDSAYYRNFLWKIMGKKLSNTEAKDVAKAKKQEILSEAAPVTNARLQGVSMIIPRTDIEKRCKFAPAKIKKCPETEKLYIKVLNRDVRVTSHRDDEEKVVQSRTDISGSAPKRYTTTCYFKPRTVPSWYTESLLIYIGSTKRRYDEKVWFKHTLQPYYWSENMTTQVNMPPTKPHVAEVVISTEKSDVHYMSLEPQQLSASAS